MKFDEVETRLRARLTGPLPGPTAQLRFAPQPVRKGWEPQQNPEGARQAAALVLIYPVVGEAVIPLTVRRDDLPHHAGQVSLPGGRVDPGEQPHEAALREAHEEIGLASSDVEVLGSLSTLWVVVSNHVIRPFVGLARRRPDFQPAPREVARILEAPIHILRDPGRVASVERIRDGHIARYPYFDLEGLQVWGATAMILGELTALLE